MKPNSPTLEARLDVVRQIALLLRGIPRSDQVTILKSVQVLLALTEDGDQA